MESFCVIGLGNFGQTIATVLEETGHQVLVIDDKEENINKIAQFVTDAVIGDATDENVLREAGVRNYDTAVICFSDRIHETIILSMMLREMGVRRVIARVNSDIEYKVLQKVGIDQIVFPEKDTGERMAHILDKHDVLEYLRFSDEYSLVERKVPKGWIGSTMIELEIRKKYGINVIAVRDGQNGKFDISFPPDKPFSKNDIITLIGSNKAIERISKAE